MSWAEQGHDGRVAMILTDGLIAASINSSRAAAPDDVINDVAAEHRRNDAPGVRVPWQEVSTWKVTCSCGWTGDERPAETHPEYGYPAPGDDVLNEWAFPQWQQHVAPFTALGDLEELTAQVAAIQARMDSKVQLARSGGASWTQIGRATGLSKQGAQQRWGSATTAATGS